VQRTLLERARTFRDEHTQRVDSYDAFKLVMEGRPGFVIAPWCGSTDCEMRIKTETQATIRNMPADLRAHEGVAAPRSTCVRCDNPAMAEAWFAKSY
jgi:prolyl-tRNA synthetase